MNDYCVRLCLTLQAYVCDNLRLRTVAYLTLYKREILGDSQLNK